MIKTMKTLIQNPLVRLAGAAVATVVAARLLPHAQSVPVENMLSDAMHHQDTLQAAVVGLIGTTVGSAQNYETDDLAYHHWLS